MRAVPCFSLLLAASVAAGCGGPAQLRYEKEIERAPRSAEHAVHSRRLAELMRDLDRLRRERLPQAMDLRTREEHRADEMAAVARAMAEAADRIPEFASALGLDGEPREAFVELAERLVHRARALADAAPRLDASALRARLGALEADCAACHRRFRIPREAP